MQNTNNLQRHAMMKILKMSMESRMKRMMEMINVTKSSKRDMKLMKLTTIAPNFIHFKKMMSCQQRSVCGGNAVIVGWRSIKLCCHRITNIYWNPQDIIKWRQWQQIPYEKEGEKKSKIGDDIKTGTMKDLLDHYINQLNDMSVHQFCKIWQLKQFNRCVRNLKPGQVLFVHDFSQNLLLYSQDEPQSRHWVHKQITIHPTVVYYKCLRNGCEEIVKEDLIHIIEDLSHDQDAVQAFLEASVEHLKQKGVEIKEIIQFSDHAASQYKSKTVFYKLSKYDIPVTNHFFAVRHGKGPANRAGGNFKVFILNTIKIGTVHLSTLEEIAEYCCLKFDKQVVCTAEKISHVPEESVSPQRDHKR